MKNEAIGLIKYQKKIEKMEQEILKLKKGGFGLPKKIISLKGILKGLEITEKEIAEAKKSLFRKVKI